MKFLSWNLENFFISSSPQQPFQLEKPQRKIEKIAETIKDLDPDILILCEVGGVNSLDEFNHQYLNQAYNHSLIEGNSDRNIHLGFMSKKGLEYKLEHYTHRNRVLNFIYPHEEKLEKRPKHFMSRDIAEFRIIKDDVIKYIILSVHLKSRLDINGVDFQGILRRKAECELLVETYQILNNRYGGNVPIFLAGDFNGNAGPNDGDLEFRSIYDKTQLQDILSLLDLPPEECRTFFSLDKNKKIIGQQFDYIFIDKKFSHLIDRNHTGVYKLKNSEGYFYPWPSRIGQLYELPSDHFPLVLTIKKSSSPM